MPRKSAASLAVVPAIPSASPTRPEPPAHLPDEAATIWRATTASRPAGYFDAGSLPLLEVYSRLVAEYRRVAAAVEAMPVDDDDFAKLTSVADKLAGRVSSLATRMRLSQQSRTDSRGAGRAAGDHRTAADRVRAAYRGD